MSKACYRNNKTTFCSLRLLVTIQYINHTVGRKSRYEIELKDINIFIYKWISYYSIVSMLPLELLLYSSIASVYSIDIHPNTADVGSYIGGYSADFT